MQLKCLRTKNDHVRESNEQKRRRSIKNVTASFESRIDTLIGTVGNITIELIRKKMHASVEIMQNKLQYKKTRMSTVNSCSP